jgi:hypothetical protein
MESRKYSLEELSVMTSYTTRTLRTYIKNGLLHGNKVNGRWTFTESDLSNFFSNDFIMQGIKIKSHALINDFLTIPKSDGMNACIIYDLPGSEEEVGRICYRVTSYITENNINGMKFSFFYDSKFRTGRFIFQGDLEKVETIIRLMKD